MVGLSKTSRLQALKRLDPTARSITLSAEPEVELEAIIDVMDASREMVSPTGQLVHLFFTRQPSCS